MKLIKTVIVAGTVMMAAYGQALAAEPAMELPAADRAVLDKLLGPGVVGAPVAGNPIADLSQVFPFSDATWTVRFVSGDNKGETRKEMFTVSKRDKAGATGQYAEGPKDTLYLQRSDDGSIGLVSEQAQNEGVITRYAPPEPMLVSGLKPGESKKTHDRSQGLRPQ